MQVSRGNDGENSTSPQVKRHFENRALVLRFVLNEISQSRQVKQINDIPQISSQQGNHRSPVAESFFLLSIGVHTNAVINVPYERAKAQREAHIRLLQYPARLRQSLSNCRGSQSRGRVASKIRESWSRLQLSTWFKRESCFYAVLCCYGREPVSNAESESAC